jgi:alpha-ribazole phosphatase
VMARVHGAIDRLLAAHAGRDICVVAHGGPIRAAIARALDLPPERSIAFMVDNCSVTRLDHIAGRDEAVWRVVMVNRPPK